MSEPQGKPITDPTVTAAKSVATPTGTGSDTGGPSSPAPNASTPAKLGLYRILSELGRGGMGVVYRAEDTALRREVALKVLAPSLTADSKAKARFVREARAQAAVEHEHVAVIHQVAEQDGVTYLVMPLLKGMTLHAAIKANPRPPLIEVIRISREIAEGLAAAHAVGLVHRDVKPANVWLEGKRLRVKVLDFGLARAAGTNEAKAPSAQADDDANISMTHAGAIIGTPSYMSPEQARGDAVDTRTDLWSLGVILYQMTTGRMPFHGKTTTAVLMDVLTQEPTPPSVVNPSIPAPLSDLTMRLLAKAASQRPHTAEDVVVALTAMEAALGNAVQVVALSDVPPIVLASGPDPFADLDITEAKTSVTSVKRVPKPSGRDTKDSGFPLWAMVGIALLGAGIAVGFVAMQFNKKPVATPTPEVIPDTANRKNPRTDGKTTTPRAPVPSNELVLFNGKDLSQWTSTKGEPASWTVRDRDGNYTQINGSAGNNIVSKQLFGDHEIHLEYWLPIGVQANSGVYVWGCYEVQIMDDFGPVLSPTTTGSIYGEIAPSKNASKPAEVWQTLVIRATGVPSDPKSVRLTVILNGETVQDKVTPTKYSPMNSATLLSTDLKRGPVVLQGHGSAVRFRNIRVRPVVDPIASRKAIEAIHAHAFLDFAQHEQNIAPTDPLPDGPLELIAIGTDGRVMPQDFAAMTIAALEGETAFTGIYDQFQTITWNEADFAKLAELPCRNTLVEFRTKLELTPKTAQLLKAFPALKGLGLNARQATDEILLSLETLFQSQRYLVITELGMSGMVTSKGWAAVLGPEIIELTLNSPQGMDRIVCANIAKLPKLTSLAIVHGQLDGGPITALALSPQLTHLNLSHSNLPPDFPRRLKLAALLHILLLCNTNVSDKDVSNLSAMKSLRSLNVGATQITEEGVKKLAAALPFCKIEWNGGVIEARNPDREVAEWALKLGGHVGFNTPKGFFDTRRGDTLPQEAFAVKGLDLAFKKEVTDDDVKRMIACPELDTLILSNTSLTEVGLTQLAAEMPKLKSLYINALPVTDKNLPLLKKLALRHLHLADTKITNASTQILAEFEKLEDLNLGGVAITDEGLPALAKMASLRILALPGNQPGITQVGVEKLSAALPRCQIQWKGQTYGPTEK